MITKLELAARFALEACKRNLSVTAQEILEQALDHSANAGNMVEPELNLNCKSVQARLDTVLKFLLGEGELEGCSFGEKPSDSRGNYWWRIHLRRALAEPVATEQQDNTRSNTRSASEYSEQEPVPYVDSTPSLHVGESSFEDWYQSHPKAYGGDKQLARDAYAAGMSDPLVTPAHPVSQEPVSQEPVCECHRKTDAVIAAESEL